MLDLTERAHLCAAPARQLLHPVGGQLRTPGAVSNLRRRAQGTRGPHVASSNYLFFLSIQSVPLIVLGGFVDLIILLFRALPHIFQTLKLILHLHEFSSSVFNRWVCQ